MSFSFSFPFSLSYDKKHCKVFILKTQTFELAFLQSFQQLMAQFTLVLVAALLISTFSYCSAENVYCVTPTATSCSSCPHNSTNCTTLSEYAQEAELYFTSDTTMVFLPGDHALNMSITVSNITRLTMRGESSSGNKATVVCSGSVGIHFTSMVEFKMNSLDFTSCGRHFTVPDFPPAPVLDLQSTQRTELVNCSFQDNIATALVVHNTDITLAGSTEFTHNVGGCGIIQGGAIYAVGSNLTFTGNTTFLDNSAGRVGIFTCTDRGGAIYTQNTVISFSGTTNFINNFLGWFGGAIFTTGNSVLNFSGTSNFINNSAVSGGAIYTSGNTVLSFNGTTNFINNSASGGGAIYADSYSKLSFSGTVNFTNNIFIVDVNEDTVGGGVYVGIQSTFSILPNTTVYWENNHATLGGAIYVEDASPLSYCMLVATIVPKEECFFQLPGQNLSNGIDVQLVFKNNSADVAGSVLYGGAIDNCKLTHGLDSHNSGEVFDMLVHIEDDTDYNTTSNITSQPLQICPCESHLPKCISESSYNFPRTVYPGETFQVSVVAVGQRDGTVPSKVISTIEKLLYPGANLQSSQKLQQAKNTCTKLNYTVLLSSQIQQVDILLSAIDSPCSKVCDTTLDISVSLYQTCPPGLSFSESAKSCVCEPRLAQYTNSCNITNGVGQITREAGQQFWVGYDKLSQSDELILYKLCPFKNCVSHTVTFPLNKSDMQCAYDRAGLLCGACKEGYSLVLGTSRCWNCPNNYHLALLIPFAVMGVALVFFLLVCKLTVATGTLSGLVFYANIIGVNRTIFLPVESTDAFSIFIAWLNLDFGIETCFYNGLDTYSKTWLQFVFPVYILILVGLIILVSHFSHRFANLLGNNPVSVLATLILLSYTKILRTLIAVFYITYLEYPTYNKGVWLYDANIDYLSGKHIPLFLVAVLVFIFLFLPYTLLLLFGQWLQAISHLRPFSWINSARLKPFMDAYHAPYKAKHRYWPGLLLVLRFILLLVFALNPQQDPSVNLLAILVGVGILHLWAWVSGGVYRNWCLDALEGSFALNLNILAAATFFVNNSRGNRVAVGYTSVSIAFATFIGILVFQLANVTGIAQYLKRKCIVVPIRKQAEAAEAEPFDIDSLPDRLINPEEYELPFHTSQGRPAAEPTEVQRRLIPVYTYGSID